MQLHKVYLKDTGTHIENMTSRDQAYRECKELELTPPHPNFFAYTQTR